MSKKTISQLLVAILIILNTSCGDSLKKKWEYQVDNPLDTEIVVKIDEKEYTIPARTTDTIKLVQGKHTLTYNGSSVNFVTKVNSNKFATVINPTLSNYMLHSFFYISEKAKNNDVSALYESYSYEYQSDEGIVKLPVRVLNALFIEESHTTWEFGINEAAKDEVKSDDPRAKQVLRKLYREAAYKKEFADDIPAGVVFPVNSKKLNELPAYKFRAESFFCDCEAANTYVKELESRWNTMIADPSDIFENVGKLSFDNTMEDYNLKKECGTQYNPGRDEKAYNEARRKLNKELEYLSDASSIIVE